MAVDDGTRAARAALMRRLSAADRAAAIASADNVVGFDRFSERHRQVELETEYRRTFKGKRP